MRFETACHIAIGLLVANSCAAQTTIVLTPSRDAGIGYHDNYNSANMNYNNATHFASFSQPGYNGGVNKGRGLIDFDLSPIPAGKTIFGAFLSVAGRGPYGVGQVVSIGHVGQNACTLSKVTTPWNENTVTWNTQPSTTAVNQATFPASTYATQNYLAVDVTDMIRDMYANPGSAHGMMLQLIQDVPGNSLAFHSSLAADADKRPTLIITYGNCEGSISIEENGPADHQMTITPNLTTAGASVLIALSKIASPNCILEVVDGTGRIVDLRSAPQWPMHYTVPSIASGTYTVLLREPGGVPIGTGRLVVQ